MEKEQYLEPDYEILLLEKSDVITESKTEPFEEPDFPGGDIW